MPSTSAAERLGHRVLVHPPSPYVDLAEALRGCATANLADGLPQDVQVILGLAPRHVDSRVLCGPALTVCVAAGDNLLAQHAIDLARAGDVIVIDGAAAVERALVSELMVRWAHARGIAGFVVDGAVRDLDYLSHGPVPVFSRSASPRGPTRSGGGGINVDASVGGAVVRAGDLVLGDADGVVCVAQDAARLAIQECQRLVARELKAIEAIRNGSLSRSWIAKALDAAAAQ